MKNWYIVQSHSSFENKVAQLIKDEAQKAKFSDRIEEIIQTALKGRTVNLERRGVEGEPGLFLLRGDIDGIETSFGIRNSGTEAKTSLSIRAKSELDGLEEIAEKISDLLQMELVP